VSSQPGIAAPTCAPIAAPPRWDLAGIAAGVLFAIVALLLAALHRHGSASPAVLLATHAQDPVLWLVDTAPAFFFAAGFLMRRQQQALLAKSAQIATLETSQRVSSEKMAGDIVAASKQLLERVSSIQAACTQTSSVVHETTDTMNQLSGSATQAALEAETVIGIARRSERTSETASAVAESTAAELKGLADEVRSMAERIEGLYRRMKELCDVAAAMSWLAERSQGLATTAARAACTGDVETFHGVASDLRGHADDALFVGKQAEGIIAEVTEAMESAMQAAVSGSKRAASSAQVIQKTGPKIQNLGVALRDSSSAAAHIAEMAQQQGGAFDQVLKAMNEICLATESNVTATQAVAEEARTLEALAASLRFAVGASPEPKRSEPAKNPSLAIGKLREAPLHGGDEVRA
jgi:methyl-accepting chemotaxis protein